MEGPHVRNSGVFQKPPSRKGGGVLAGGFHFSGAFEIKLTAKCAHMADALEGLMMILLRIITSLLGITKEGTPDRGTQAPAKEDTTHASL
jgi:hypothetical protein